MISASLDKQELLQQDQSNIYHVDGVAYTYDAEFDVLRVNFGNYLHQALVEERAGGDFIAFNQNGDVEYIEVLDFMKDYSPDVYDAILVGKERAQQVLKDIHKELQQ